MLLLFQSFIFQYKNNLFFVLRKLEYNFISFDSLFSPYFYLSYLVLFYFIYLFYFILSYIPI